jgi:hypothetical protein
VMSSGDSSSFSFKVTDENLSSSWYWANYPNSWITFDFQRNRIKPTGYVIKSNNQNNCYLVGWVIKGSNDGLDWTKFNE